MPVIIGTNYQFPQAFGFMNTNPDLQAIPYKDFEDATGLKQGNGDFGNIYQQTRMKWWAQSLNDSPDGRNLKGSFTEAISFDIPDRSMPINNLYHNKSAWQKLFNINSNGGYSLAFDTETIGDFTQDFALLKSFDENVQNAMKYAGITEIGFDVRSVNRNGKRYRMPKGSNLKGSFVFGIDQEQKSYIEGLLNKKIKGEVLNKNEVSTLERMSRYSTIDHNGHSFKTYTHMWQGKEYVFTNSINISNPDSIEDIRSGIESLSRLYAKDRDKRISSVIQYINEFEHRNDSVIIGQNLNYDVQAIAQYSKSKGIEGLSDTFKYADTMYALRAYAQENNTTVHDFIKSHNLSVTNKNLGSLEAFIESISDTTDYAQFSAHNAYLDSIASQDVMFHNGLAIIPRTQDIISNPNVKKINLSEKFIKINSKGNVRHSDFIVIDNQITNSYSPTNQYWKFVGAGNTDFDELTIEVNGKEKRIKDTKSKYVARFESANGDGANLFKVFDTKEQANSWIVNNTEIFNVDSPDVDIEFQNELHNQDIIRRELDRFSDTNVSVKKPTKADPFTDVGGFEDFKKYYDAYLDIRSISDESIQSMSLVDINGNKITNSMDLIRNISVGDNIDDIIKYGDENNITSIQRFFRSTQEAQALDPHHAGILRYNSRIFMEGIFDVFEKNKDFFEYASESISSVSGNNLQKTLLYKGMLEDYLSMSTTKISDTIKRYTISDLNNVSIKTGKNVWSNLDVTNKNAAYRLQRMFTNSGDTEIAVSNRLFSVVDDLVDRKLLSTQDRRFLSEAYGSGQYSYSLSQSIVTRLNANTQDIRDLGLNQFIQDKTNIESLNGDFSGLDDNIADRYTRIQNKNHRTIYESSSSKLMFAEGTISDGFKTVIGQEHIDKISNVSVIKKGIDKETKEYNRIFKTLSEMHYSDEIIEDFISTFYSHGDRSTNINVINKELEKESKEQIKFAFYKSSKHDDSAFAIFTTEKNYTKLLNSLYELDDDVSSAKVRETIESLGSYYEIPYLDVFDIDKGYESDKVIRKLTEKKNKPGHGARTVIVKKGDSYMKYDTLSLNIWQKDGVFHGNIKDQGDTFLTGFRPRMQRALSAVSEGNFSSATRSLNDYTKKKMSDAASPQTGGTFDTNGKIVTAHLHTTKDIDYAHMITIDPKHENMGLLKLMENFATSEMSKYSGEGTATEAISNMYEAFNEAYDFVTQGSQNLNNVKKVFESEQFTTFYNKNLTSQSGGIKNEKFIADYIMAHPDSKLALVQDKSIIEIMQQAAYEISIVGDDLRDTLDLLADSGLNNIGSEAMMKNGTLFVGNYHYGENNNSRLSGIYRPTYAQRSNYRAFRLQDYFYDPEDLENNLGIHFGDTYTSSSKVERIKTMDMRDTLIADRNTITMSNITGAVASISDADIQAFRASNLDKILREHQDLNQGAMRNIYEEMLSSMNMYEGKAYLRPSLANQPFFMLGDPKTVRSNEIRDIYAFGTDIERQSTENTLNKLVGKRVDNGTVIGYRLNKNNHINMVPVYYNGQTIDYFTQQNVTELLENGKTTAIVTRQLEDGKIMVGEEKATYETFTYFNAIREDEQLSEIKARMKGLGFTDDQISDNLQENIKTLNKYTDIVMDATASVEGSRHKVVAMMNNNIEKHITDMPFDTKWNIIAGEFEKSEDTFKQFKTIANEVQYDKGTLGEHISYDSLRRTITFDNPSDKGSINALDRLIERLESSDIQEAKNAVNELHAFSASQNISYQSIQRQQMNTFQAQAFRMDARVYQTLVNQGGGNAKNYIKNGNGAMLAERIRSNIAEGIYDRNITGLNGRYKNINATWSEMVRARRGILAPKNETAMYHGVIESLKFRNDHSIIEGKNILRIKMDDIIEHIPESGSNYEGYMNFIFKSSKGEYSSFLKSYAHLNDNNFNVNANSNSFYVDFGRKVKYGEEEIEGILLPFQYLDATEDQIFVGESTSRTIAFFNEYNKMAKSGEEIDITDSLNDLYKAYARELDTSDKKSLASKSAFRMNMPNSSGALALDAIVPTLNLNVSVNNEKLTVNDVKRLNELQSKLSNNISVYGLNDQVIQDISEYNRLYKLRENIIDEQIRLIKTSNTGLIDLLNLTGKEKYGKYILGHDNNGNEVIESVVVVGKQMFKDTEMDTGHIGHQIISDYFTINKNKKIGLLNYDSFSKITGKDFFISNKEFKDTFEDLFESFKGTFNEDWAEDTKREFNKILFKNDNTSFSIKQSKAMKYFNKSFNERLAEIEAGINITGDKSIIDSLEKELGKRYKEEFITQVYSQFENIGDRYASEVGILGNINRYPNFSHTGTLPVRIFLDETIHGHSTRLLGPQFSIFQNVDFDGDNEFIKFLGNGGLIAKNEVSKELRDEAERLNVQFEYMNQFNKAAFADSVQDSVKAYRYGDETAFKATLLKNLDSDTYKSLRADFESNLTTNEKQWFDTLHGDVQDYIFDHNKTLLKAYEHFDEELGTSIDNIQMVRAAILARHAKNYIGNFSKPNLEIRNTLNFMLSLVEDNSAEESKLLKIQDLMFSFSSDYSKNEIQSFGLLTLLEQQGIDTKHVHDADILNNSTAWRQGVSRLFTNANGANAIDDKARKKAVNELVEGARKVFFNDATTKKEFEMISSEIMSKSLSEFEDDIEKQIQQVLNDNIGKSERVIRKNIEKSLTDNGSLGKLYIRGLYELSTMDNAYAGFYSSFRKTASNKNFANLLDQLSFDNPNMHDLISNISYDELSDTITRHGYDFDAIFAETLMKSANMYKTDESLQVFNRTLKVGDLLAYQGEQGPTGFIVSDFYKHDNGLFNLVLDEYDFAKGDIKKAKSKIVSGMTIADINEKIKQNPRTKIPDHYLLDYTQISESGNTNKNISLRYINNLSEEERKALVQAHAAAVSVEDKLNQLFERKGDADFDKYFQRNIQDKGITVRKYSNANINNTIGQIVGTDADLFRRKANVIEEYIQYGIDKQYIYGSKDAKDIIRQINKNIAENPRKNLTRFQGEDLERPFDLITNYLGGDFKIYGDRKWLSYGINNIAISNQIEKNIRERIEAQRSNFMKYAETFNEAIVNNVTEAVAFNTARQSFEAEVQSTMNDVFSQIRTSNDANLEMMRVFGWDSLDKSKNQDFLIKDQGVTIRTAGSDIGLEKRLGNAKVGYGRYIGTKLSDINSAQKAYILDTELTQDVIDSLQKDSIEYYAAINTRTLLNSLPENQNPTEYLDFTSADTLRHTYASLNANTESEAKAARQAAMDSLKEAVEENAKSGKVKKKTLLGDSITQAIRDMSPETKSALKTVGAVAAGAFGIGLIGHALFNNDDKSNVEVPRSVTEQIGNGDNPQSRKIISNKSDLGYSSQQSEARQPMRQKKIAPPSLHKNRTIYHDAGSGFNFKVSAQSYQKLQAESYQRMAQQAGINNNSMYISRDNSKITDNWLENKFAQLME